MKTIVIGAGEVGVNVARTLTTDGHDVTVVEARQERCATIRGELDALVVEGNGARGPPARRWNDRRPGAGS